MDSGAGDETFGQRGKKNAWYFSKMKLPSNEQWTHERERSQRIVNHHGRDGQDAIGNELAYQGDCQALGALNFGRSHRPRGRQ